jgi:hypothetical protein
MSHPLPRPLALLAVSAIALGCGASPPPAPTSPATPTTTTGALPASAGTASKKVFVKHDPAWAACHATYKPMSTDLVAESNRAGKGCEAVTKMKPILRPQSGTQGDTNPPQEVKFEGKAGNCYRVYAMADAGIKDLDLLLKDSTGAIAAEDSTDDASPVLAEDGAICFKEIDDVTLVVSVGAGKGSWALEIWSDEPR